MKLVKLFYKRGRQEKFFSLDSTAEVFSLGVQPLWVREGLFWPGVPCTRLDLGSSEVVPSQRFHLADVTTPINS